MKTDLCRWTLKLQNISLVSQDLHHSPAPISLALLSLLLVTRLSLLLVTNFRIGSCPHAENPSMLRYLSPLSKILKMAIWPKGEKLGIEMKRSGLRFQLCHYNTTLTSLGSNFCIYNIMIKSLLRVDGCSPNLTNIYCRLMACKGHRNEVDSTS